MSTLDDNFYVIHVKKLERVSETKQRGEEELSLLMTIYTLCTCKGERKFHGFIWNPYCF